MKKENGKILIVDDLPENVLVVEKTLQKEGFHTEIATTGEEAIERIRVNRPDLLLLDVLMPKTDGFEVARQIKSDEDIKYVPIIFLTALNEPKYIIEGFNVGGVDFISKPFNLTELLARVKTHVDLKKAQEANKALINKLKVANKDLKTAKTKLTELNNNKDKFFSIIAHDLRNPFLGFSKLTEYIHNEFDNLSREELREMIGDIYKSADKLNKLLENLLAWSRIQLGKIDIRKEEYNLRKIVDMNVGVFESNAAAKNITVINDVDDDISIVTDLQMINTVIRNIFSNAIKFSDVFGKVMISSEKMHNSLLLRIDDYGIGMDKEEVSKLFSIDTQTIKTGTAGESGTGLGMILTKELLDKLEYKISVKSEVDKGASFIIEIPYNDMKK